MRGRLRTAILTTGFSGLVAQMLILRELLVVFSGNELSIGIILANWLILEAFGCAVLGKKAEKTAGGIEKFVIITILFSLSLPAAVYAARISRHILGISPGEGMGLVPMLFSSFLVLAPVSITHGALFTFSCKIYSVISGRQAESAGRVYAYETAGVIAGGIAWTYLLIPYLHSFHTAVGLAVLNLLVCFVLISAARGAGASYRRTITAGACLLLFLGGYLLVSGGADKLHRSSVNAQWKGQDVVHYQNSIYGNICVIESGGQYTFFTDGVPHIVTPVPDIVFVEEFVHLPLLSHPDPGKVLILGGGAGGVINEVLKHGPVEAVDYAELDPLLLELIRKYSTPLTEAELTDDRVGIKHVDGRLFLKMTEEKYDLIMVGFSEPAELQTNRFFTKEFFSLAEKKLEDEGVLVISLPGSLTYLADELRNLNSCIFNTLGSVFSFVRVLPGDGTNIFLSSNSEDIALFDKSILAARLEDRGVETSLIVPWHIEYKLHPRWGEWFLEFIEDGTERLNRDFEPLGLFYSIAHWNALFTPYLRGLFRWFERINLRIFFVIFIVFSVFFMLMRIKNKKLPGSYVPLCVATTGFAGMVFDLALIFTFQAIYGYIFAWIGLLVTCFMSGAAIGAMVVTSGLARIKNDLKAFRVTELLIIGFASGLPVIFLLLHPYLDSPALYPFLRILFLLLTFISGLLIGAQFPLANKIYLKDSASLSKAAGLVYGFDLLGGWLGGIVGGVVLLPVLGLPGACVLVVLLKLSSLMMTTA